MELLNAVSVCKALADPNRLQIVQTLTKGERCACDLLETLQIGQSTLSHHMAILNACGLVSVRKEGKWSYYSLNCDAWTAFRDYIDAIRCTCPGVSTDEKGCCCK